MDLNKVVGISKVREGGKWTIPEAVVDELELEPGDSIEWFKMKGDDTIYLHKYGKEIPGLPEYESLGVATVRSLDIN